MFYYCTIHSSCINYYHYEYCRQVVYPDFAKLRNLTLFNHVYLIFVQLPKYEINKYSPDSRLLMPASPHREYSGKHSFLTKCKDINSILAQLRTPKLPMHYHNARSTLPQLKLSVTIFDNRKFRLCHQRFTLDYEKQTN